MPRSRFVSLVLALALAAATAAVTAGPALAWPDTPPDRATISGPGLAGTVEITDLAALKALKLGAMEDLNAGPIAAPHVTGDGYTITRYFGGDFTFASLRYYPEANGQGYVYWQDGAKLEGSQTPFNNQWLAATPAGDAAMKQLLSRLGVSLSAPGPASAAPAPAAIGLPAVWPWLAALLAVAALAGGWLAVRRRRLT